MGYTYITWGTHTLHGVKATVCCATGTFDSDMYVVVATYTILLTTEDPGCVDRAGNNDFQAYRDLNRHTSAHQMHKYTVNRLNLSKIYHLACQYRGPRHWWKQTTEEQVVEEKIMLRITVST